MKIAVDIDEVLARGLESYLEYFNAEYGTNVTPEDFTTDRKFWDVLGVAEADILQVEAHYRKSHRSKDWLLVPGAQQGVANLAQDHELVIISNRKKEGHGPTVAWLDKNFPGIFGKVYFTEAERTGDIRPSKAEICLRIGAQVLIEDEVPEIKACESAGIRVVLFNTRLNQGVGGKGVMRVYDWDEAIQAIHSIK